MVSWTSGPTERSSVGDVQVPHSHAVQWRWGGCFGSDVNLHLILWCKDLTAATFMLTRPGAVQVGSCWIWFSRQKRQTSLGVTGKEIRWNVWHSEGSGVETQSFVWVWAKGCTGLRAGCLLTVHGECVLLVDWGTELKAFCCFSGRYFFLSKTRIQRKLLATRSVYFKSFTSKKTICTIGSWRVYKSTLLQGTSTALEL